MIDSNQIRGDIAFLGLQPPPDCSRLAPNTVHLDYARTRNCACRCGVRTRACRVETHLDAWVSRTQICETRGTGVEMSLDAARTSACATPMPVYLSEQCCSYRAFQGPKWLNS